MNDVLIHFLIHSNLIELLLCAGTVLDAERMSK
jgi:hypothetical protein